VVVVTGRGAAGGSLITGAGGAETLGLVRSGSFGRDGVAGWFVGFHIVVEILSYY
jgi:hypothetical protein